jgi:hypothetical protein
MRNWIAPAAVLLLAAPLPAQPKAEPPPHFGVAAETEFYPQDSPKQAMASIAKALDRGRIDYLLAHLIDPAFTDATFVKYYRQKYGKTPDEDRTLPRSDFESRIKAALASFVGEVKDHLAAEPKQTLRLNRLLKEGSVEESGTSATVTLKDAPGVALNLKQADGRWFMANALEAEKTKK